MTRVALIGATGLVGSHLLERLLAEHEVVSLSRRASGFEHPRLTEHIGPMSGWANALTGQTIDVAISALGTTWRKAGSWEAFEEVDLYGVVDFARAAGARQIIAISSVGANPHARNRYLRIKGRMERGLGAVARERLDILRPGLLRGKRPGERRAAERLGILLSPIVNLLLIGRLDRFAAIDAGVVARAASALVGREGGGTHVHENRAIRTLAGG